MIISEVEPEIDSENITEVAKRRRKFNSFRENSGSRKENSSRLGNMPTEAQMVSEFNENGRQRAQILPNSDKVIEDSKRNKNSTFISLQSKSGKNFLQNYIAVCLLTHKVLHI